jgi:hypothetical protein
MNRNEQRNITAHSYTIFLFTHRAMVSLKNTRFEIFVSEKVLKKPLKANVSHSIK